MLFGAQTPLHPPDTHAWLPQSIGVPHWPPEHASTPLPTHWVVPEEQTGPASGAASTVASPVAASGNVPTVASPGDASTVASSPDASTVASWPALMASGTSASATVASGASASGTPASPGSDSASEDASVPPPLLLVLPPLLPLPLLLPVAEPASPAASKSIVSILTLGPPPQAATRLPPSTPARANRSQGLESIMRPLEGTWPIPGRGSREERLSHTRRPLTVHQPANVTQSHPRPSLGLRALRAQAGGPRKRRVA